MMRLLAGRDVRWLAIWLGGLGLAGAWNAAFLNRPALALILTGFLNTFAVAGMVLVFCLGAGWGAAVALHYSEERTRPGYLVLTFLLNLIRSVPQIVGILFGYVWIAEAMKRGTLRNPSAIFILMSAVTALFIFNEMSDLMRERIAHFKKGDFYSAMRVCGISKARIVNFHILWKNSRMHVFNKLISVFGMAVFLQCSVSFIISVGLSTEVDLITLPSTLGSVLANIDSKQDILAVGYTFTHPAYITRMFFNHLQGLTTAFVLVFSLLCIHRISTGFAERHRL
ncbi:MAG: hypothetical protein ABIW76_16665 [Fibrobacteria bacterium]